MAKDPGAVFGDEFVEGPVVAPLAAADQGEVIRLRAAWERATPATVSSAFELF